MENRLRSLRTQRKWSQVKLAELLAVSRLTINALEKGKYDPSLPLAMKIAQLFDCPIEAIFLPTEDFREITMSEKGSILDQLTAKVAQAINPARFDQGDILNSLSPHAKQVILLAQEEGHRLKHKFVGTEQILLGLIAEESAMAAQMLKTVGVTLEAALIAVEKIIGRGRGGDLTVSFTPRAKFALVYAAEESRKRGQSYI